MAQLENQYCFFEKENEYNELEDSSDVSIQNRFGMRPSLKYYDSNDEDGDQNDEGFQDAESGYQVPEEQPPQNISEQSTIVKRPRVSEKKKIKEPKIKKVIVKKERKTSVANPSKNFPAFFIRYMVKLAEKSFGTGWLKEKYPKLGKVVSRKNHSIQDLNCFLIIQELRKKFIESLENNDMLFYILDSNKLLSIEAYIDVLSIYYQQAKTDGTIKNQTRCQK